MKIGIYNHETGEQEVRDMTPEEIADIEADAVAAAEKRAAKAAQAEAKAAVLEKLGLTAEEVAALLA
jgi:hypothetical protein